MTGVTIAREKGIYACFPDLARTREGKLVCVYRESDSHGARDFAHLVWKVSLDQGRSWSGKRRLIESHRDDQGFFKWNCPRIGQTPDGRMWILCDGYPVPPGEKDLLRSRVFFWWSENEGESWAGPFETPITGIVPDRLCVLRSGTWLAATHVRSPRTDKLMQTLWRSEDAGKTWQGPVTICEHESYNACEASILPLPDGELVCYMRENSGLGCPGLKCFSQNEGKTWTGLHETLIAGCHRPVAGLLPGDRVLITYRWYLGGRSPNRHFFAYQESVSSAKARSLSEQSGRVREIDHDRSPRPDTGYSGWVILPGGSIFCVNYIVDDFPTAQIRGYRFGADLAFGRGES